MAEIQDAIDATRSALGQFLGPKMPALTQILYDFPDANVEFSPPSLTISHYGTEDAFTPLQPYEIARSAPALDGTMIVTSVVGMWDFKLQLDFWSRYEPERNQLFASFFEAFANSRNEPEDPLGLNLQLPAYHNIWARCDFVGYSHMDAEEPQQQGIWRTKVTLVVNTRAVLSKTVHQIKVIENNPEVLDTNQSID